MSKFSDIIHVKVEYSTEDEECGPMYVASCQDLHIVIDGKTLDELLINLREALCEHGDCVEFDATHNPRVVLNLELPFAEMFSLAVP